MSENRETILREDDERGISILTMNRPGRLNALNRQMFRELDELLDVLAEKKEVRGLILTGTGEKAFVAGADIKELEGLDESAARELSLDGQRIFQKLEQLPFPVVAAVNGYALGGGLELAMACHLRVASETALLGMPETGLGLIPGYGGTQRLPRLVGVGLALEMLLTGRKLTAAEALEAGLLNRVTGQDTVVDEAQALLQEILDKGPHTIPAVVKAVSKSGLPGGFETEAEHFGRLCDSEDGREGIRAFIEKRKPMFGKR
ncbi:MAG: enoyl-CoA hydratase-related protein [Balneolaceae bacterium]